MKKFAIAVAVSLLLSASAFAADPNPANSPVLSIIQKLGAKFYYLGNRAGLDGWFVVKDGQSQVAYVTPDNKSVLIGALFGENGENITALQVAALVQGNKEVADLVAATQKALPPGAAPMQPATTPPAPLSPGEKLLHDFSSAATVVMGNLASPEILMVMDPSCPHCQQTWKDLHSYVADGSIHLRMIPIGTFGTDEERAAAILLTSADPLHAWDAYVSGDQTALAGTPEAKALADVRANHAMVEKWNVQNTPYLAYRASNGKVKIVQGEPNRVSALLADVGR